MNLVYIDKEYEIFLKQKLINAFKICRKISSMNILTDRNESKKWQIKHLILNRFK